MPPEDFERLLTWLNPDREQAGRRYEAIRQSLIKIFIWRGVTEAEDLADEAIVRVTRRIEKIASGYVGDPAAYFYAVANRLWREYERKRKLQVPLDSQRLIAPAPTDDSDTSEAEYQCLKRCVGHLSADDRDLIQEYYSKERQAKIDHRRELAARSNISANALRVRVYRIRVALEKCIEECLKAQGV